MAEKKDRERVIAEMTLSHLMRLGNEQGCRASTFSLRSRQVPRLKKLLGPARLFLRAEPSQHQPCSPNQARAESFPVSGYEIAARLSDIKEFRPLHSPFIGLV